MASPVGFILKDCCLGYPVIPLIFKPFVLELFDGDQTSPDTLVSMGIETIKSVIYPIKPFVIDSHIPSVLYQNIIIKIRYLEWYIYFYNAVHIKTVIRHVFRLKEVAKQYIAFHSISYFNPILL